jgi:hypothetical protein
MKKLNTLLVIAFIAILTACSKDDAKTEPTPTVTEKPVDVYVATYNRFANDAKYYKNGIATNIPTTGNNELNYIGIVGNYVYVAGYNGVSGSSALIPTYWKNGTPTQIAPNGYCTSFYISGNDTYASGVPQGAGNNASYWKNNTQINLPSTAGFENTSSTAIKVFNTDVYIAGYESKNAITNAIYWKNGNLFKINDNSQRQITTAIDVANNNLYIAGYQWVNSRKDETIAKYWKNGIAINLTDGTSRAQATDIKVVGNDVYVAGFFGRSDFSSSACYWKNGEMIELTTGGKSGQAKSIFILGNDVYVSGYEERDNNKQIATYWKNGVATTLGTVEENIRSGGIFVKYQ